MTRRSGGGEELGITGVATCGGGASASRGTSVPEVAVGPDEVVGPDEAEVEGRMAAGSLVEKLLDRFEGLEGFDRLEDDVDSVDAGACTGSGAGGGAVAVAAGSAVGAVADCAKLGLPDAARGADEER